MQERYGEALFSIPVNLDFGCPNRDTNNNGGCTFCPEHGSRAAQIADAKSVEEQIEHAIAFAKRRYKANKFALYIQAYTGTFASLRTQKEAYERLLNVHPFYAIHIGTRPDCLSEETLCYLKELSQSIDVVVELGVQSLHDESLIRINRGHDARTSREAIKRLHEKGIRVYAHLIIGLEGENEAMWQASVKELVELKIDGIKFHNLHVIRNTELAQAYEKNPFPLLDEYAYAEALIALLRLVPSHIPIIRLSTDTPDKERIAPLWHMSKGQFGNYIVQTMALRGIVQGEAVEPHHLKKETPLKTIALEDGSITAWNHTYRDYYHPKAGAYRQAKELFIVGSQLAERLQKGDVTLLDIGFGMGYNTFCALECAHNVGSHTLHVKAIDHDKILLKQSANVVPEALHVTMLERLFSLKRYENVEYLNLEARYAITLLDTAFDVVFLDPFLESNNASLVSLEFFQVLRNLLKPDGILVASTSLHVSQSGLRMAGFDVSLVHLPNSDIKGIVATLSTVKTDLHVKPYRDPHLILSDKEIESAHQKRQV